VREVEQFMANRLLHEELLASNGLHALSQWIAPYEDGSLPNTKVGRAGLGVVAASLACPLACSVKLE
jgi:hypothetical protein